jgi:hypothetical protein
VNKGRAVGEVLELDNEKQLLKQYYARLRIPSPNGGVLMFLGVRPDADGSATAILECSVSSLRYDLKIPKASRSERKAVKEAVAAGRDPDCPRHGPGEMLVRAGPELVCRSCGISYGKA